MAVLMRLLDDPFEQVYEQTTTDCMQVRSVRHEHITTALTSFACQPYISIATSL